MWEACPTAMVMAKLLAAFHCGTPLKHFACLRITPITPILLKDKIRSETAPEVVNGNILNLTVDAYITKHIATVTQNSPVIKALSIMEKFNSSYVFLVDGEQYMGVITRMAIARLLNQYHKF